MSGLLGRVQWGDVLGAPQDWWGTVTDTDPVMVRRDGQSTPVRVAATLGVLDVAQRVLCRSIPTAGPGQAKQIVVLGVSGVDVLAPGSGVGALEVTGGYGSEVITVPAQTRFIVAASGNSHYFAAVEPSTATTWRVMIRHRSSTTETITVPYYWLAR